MDRSQVRETRQLSGASAGALPVDPTLLPHDNYKANIIAASVVCWIIGLTFTVMRIYTKRVILRAYDWSDTCIIVSMVNTRRVILV